MFISKNIEELYNSFSEAVYESGTLDRKTKELIAVGASVMADCVPCIEYHFNAAIRNGASVDEIREAFAIAISISSGSKKAKYTPLFEKLASGE
jgi:AhpD family alkylhydroperoxidase